YAGTLDDLLLVVGIGAILRPLEIIEALPARLRAHKGLPVEIHIETLGDEKALMLRHEIVESHALGGDLHARAGVDHGNVSLLPSRRPDVASPWFVADQKTAAKSGTMPRSGRNKPMRRARIVAPGPGTRTVAQWHA